MRRSLAALSALVLSLPLFAACSSATTDPDPSTTEDVGPQGPLSGTYSADSLDGTSPFVAITFLDASHYSYISTSCNEPGPSGDMEEDDPADPAMDGDASPSEDSSDDGCIHNGTYKLSQTDLTLTDDGSSKSVDVKINALAMNGTEVTDPNADGTNTGSGTSLTTTDSLVVGSGTSQPDAVTLVDFLSQLFGQSSVSSFQGGGRSMRRTSLVRSPSSSSSSSSESSSSSSSSSSSGGLVTSSAVAAAMQWVNVQMPYCQAANHQRDYDKSCPSVCNRTGAADQPQWNKYRSDCSGLVSWAWTLKAPGLDTRSFVPGAAKYVAAQDLQPGDALLRAGHHIVLFEKWIDKAHGKAKVIAEPGCSAKGGPHAQEQTWSLGHAPTASPSGSWNGTTYSAIRKKGSQLTAH